MAVKRMSCLRCQSSMEKGFVPDRGDSGIGEKVWVAGEPTKSFWTGIKVKKTEMLKVITYRCTRCGYLESYAKDAKA